VQYVFSFSFFQHWPLEERLRAVREPRSVSPAIGWDLQIVAIPSQTLFLTWVDRNVILQAPLTADLRAAAEHHLPSRKNLAEQSTHHAVELLWP
jgi:hypothetical protein